MCKQARSAVLLGNIKSMKGPPILADQDQNIHGVLITCHGKKVSSVFFFFLQPLFRSETLATERS